MTSELTAANFSAICVIPCKVCGVNLAFNSTRYMHGLRSDNPCVSPFEKTYHKTTDEIFETRKNLISFWLTSEKTKLTKDEQAKQDEKAVSLYNASDTVQQILEEPVLRLIIVEVMGLTPLTDKKMSKRIRKSVENYFEGGFNGAELSTEQVKSIFPEDWSVVMSDLQQFIVEHTGPKSFITPHFTWDIKWNQAAEETF
jgi:hypothetical protein